MSDLVHRLCDAVANWPKSSRRFYSRQTSLIGEAADELERLTRELEEARKKAALYEVARHMNVPQWQEALLLNLKTGKPFDQIVADLAPFYGLPHPDAQEK